MRTIACALSLCWTLWTSAQQPPIGLTPDDLMRRATTHKTVGIVTASVGAAVILVGEITARRAGGAVENRDAHLVFGAPLVVIGVGLNLSGNGKQRRAVEMMRSGY